ncbi:MAG: L-threonylcarbamoyladenylate synthase [Patescibacteria group bacterium]
MIIRQIDPQQPDSKIITEAAEILKSGGVIIYPTDTTYGIGVDPSNPVAMNKLINMKGRDVAKGVSLIIARHEQIDRVAITDPRLDRILAHYLPGPYSFLLVNKNFAYCPLSAVMIRIPNLATTQALAESYSRPYTTTSANFSGEPPAHSLADLEESLLNPERMVIVPDMVLDGGSLPLNPPSTIVDLTNWPPKILRQGWADFDWQLFD